jgi:isoquinoline 1-oxidoreductase beta subunit
MKTSNQFKFSRRSFLQTSALASGGMLIGFNLFTACKPEVKPPVDLSLLDYNDFNAFIKISDDGKVTIFNPNPEIGQGVKTSMPMLIAEELDVAWKDVHVAQGALDTENYTRQVAGGSQSLRQGWEPLRQTGATARQMLVNAAAAQWGVDAAECTTKEGVITNASGETLGYGDVVQAAAALEVPEDAKLKDPKDFTIIGKDISNVDIDEIVTGKPLFGLDYKREGMLYASVLRPPAFGQALDSYDDGAARAVKGVTDVIRFDKSELDRRLKTGEYGVS